jgi:hypothetical protein
MNQDQQRSKTEDDWEAKSPALASSSRRDRAKAGAFAYLAGKPPPLFEQRRVRKAGKGRAIAKRRRIPLLFWREEHSLF